MDNTRRTIAEGASRALGMPVIRSEQTGKPPAYPYASYTITTLATANQGTWGEYPDGARRKPVRQVWSLTVQSTDCVEAMERCCALRDWLDQLGRRYLNDSGVIVEALGDVTDRSSLLAVAYEYRFGFDMTLWMLDELAPDTAPEAEPGVIETVEFHYHIGA